MNSFLKRCVSFTLFLMAPAAGLFAQHFAYTSNTGNNMTVLVQASINPTVSGSTIANGDDIGVFTPAGLCVGSTVWNGSNTAITVWGDNDQTPATDGMKAGDTLKYRVWDASLSLEVPAVVAYTSGGPVYSVDGMAILSSLVASMTAPAITAHPSNQTITEGQTATFSVIATGTGLSYQWQKGTANITGATSASYTTPAAIMADDGSTYRCVVSNSGGSATSNSATLTVTRVAPTISSHPPIDQTVTEGQTATFSVTATGTGLSYQWQKGTTNITGATSASYTTPPATMADSGSTYRCVVSNSGGSATTSPAPLTVIRVAPTISSQPANQTVTEGQTATFSVTATGTGLSYQWQKGTTNITGATSATYTTPSATMADDGSTYRCVVSNSGGSATSNNATLTVTQNIVSPSITTQPSNVSIAEGQTATFSVVASGTSPLSYQWQKGTTNITGATSASYTTPTATMADDGSTYRCLVSNSGGSATSNSATLTVTRVAPTISSQPANQTVTEAQTATFSVTATGTGLSYQWQKGTANITGATSASYTTPAVTMADNGSTYRCVVSNSGGSATSNNATLMVNALTFTLTTSSNGNGTVTPSGATTVASGASTPIKATAAAGYNFSHWTIAQGSAAIADSTKDSTTVVLSAGNAEVRALFKKKTYVLTIARIVGQDAPVTVKDTLVTHGDTLYLTAPTVTGIVFLKWRITAGTATLLDSTQMSCRVILLSGNATISAMYDRAVSIISPAIRIPTSYGISYNSHTGIITFAIPKATGFSETPVRIRMYDARGQLMGTVFDRRVAPGYYNASAGLKGKTAMEMVICRMEATGFSRTVKVMMMNRR